MKHLSKKLAADLLLEIVDAGGYRPLSDEEAYIVWLVAKMLDWGAGVRVASVDTRKHGHERRLRSSISSR
jgi:hypothetical protein